MSKQNIYFVSDVHLGHPNHSESRIREILLIKWLDEIKPYASEIYLLGDIFDFWFEYKNVVPRGFVRLLGKLAELTDSGITINFFTGNHDLWVFDYLSSETGVKIYRTPLIKTYNNKKFFIAHGDGLGKFDRLFKFYKSIFTNRFFQWLFSWIHPTIGISIARFWSNNSRRKHNYTYSGLNNEWLVLYAQELLKNKHYDFFVFGHRHIPIDILLPPKTRLLNIGDWMRNYTYAVFNGDTIELKSYTNTYENFITEKNK